MGPIPGVRRGTHPLQRRQVPRQWPISRLRARAAASLTFEFQGHSIPFPFGADLARPPTAVVWCVLPLHAVEPAPPVHVRDGSSCRKSRRGRSVETECNNRIEPWIFARDCFGHSIGATVVACRLHPRHWTYRCHAVKQREARLAAAAVGNHVIIGALSAPGKLRHETARRLARPTRPAACSDFSPRRSAKTSWPAGPGSPMAPTGRCRAVQRRTAWASPVGRPGCAAGRPVFVTAEAPRSGRGWRRHIFREMWIASSERRCGRRATG